MLNNLGTVEVIVVSFILLVLFGGKKLNDIARGLGQSQKEFEKAKKEYQDVITEVDTPPTPPETTSNTTNKTEDNPQSQGGGLDA